MTLVEEFERNTGVALGEAGREALQLLAIQAFHTGAILATEAMTMAVRASIRKAEQGIDNADWDKDI